MSFVHITLYTLLRNIRDWKFLLLLIVAPLITIMVTGNATITSDKRLKTEKVKIVYYNADTGNLGSQFEGLLNSKETGKAFYIVKTSSLGEGQKKVKSGRFQAFIFIDKGFSESLIKGQRAKIEVYSGKKLTAANLLVDGFVNNFNATAALSETGNKISLNNSPIMTQNAIRSTKKAPNGMDRWTYMNMLLFLFYGAILGSFTVISGFKKNTIVRFNLSPINRYSHVAGLFTGNLMTLFGCSLVMIVFTKFLFGSNWQGNVAIILLTYLLYSAFTVALGMLLGYLSKKPGLNVLIIVSLNILLGVPAATLANGGINEIFNWLKFFSPHYYSYMTIGDTIFKGPAERMYHSLISLTIFTVVLALLTLVTGRRKTA